MASCPPRIATSSVGSQYCCTEICVSRMSDAQRSPSENTCQFGSVLSSESLQLLFLALPQTTVFALPAPDLRRDKACGSYFCPMYDRQCVVVVEYVWVARDRGRDVPHHGHDVHRDRLHVCIRYIVAAARIEQRSDIDVRQRFVNAI